LCQLRTQGLRTPELAQHLKQQGLHTWAQSGWNGI
jgi:hypothetical protein